jgi:hypothetical protein
MIVRNGVALLSMVAAFGLVACGGGEAPKSQASAPPASELKPAAAAPAAGGTASVTGKVSFEGTAPAAEKVKLSADPKCAALHKDGLERFPFHVKDGGVADVLVYVKTGAPAGSPAPTEPVVLDQNGCDYEPHMLGIRVNQPLKIRNSDDTLHNIHPRPQTNAEFNIGQPRQGMESTKTFDKPEIMIPIGCDVHPWMRAYISVFDHPYFTVSKEDGTFSLAGLPAGEYEVEAVHGKLKSQTQKVTVKDGEAATVNFTFKG